MSRVVLFELLILPISAGVVVLGIVMARKGKLPAFAGGLGTFQGLFALGVAASGGPPKEGVASLGYPHQYETAVSVAILILQGIAMLVFSLATYRRKLWGACGLCIVVALTGAMWFLLSRTLNGLLSVFVYASAAVSIHRARGLARAQFPAPESTASRSCPHCGARYMLSDYRADAASIVCSNCAGSIYARR